VINVDTTHRRTHSKPWQMPKYCPSCHTPVVRIEGEVAVRCPNEEGCVEQKIRRLAYFAGKNAMDIDHMGEKVIVQLVQKGFIDKPSDIYQLTSENLFQLTGFKLKSVQNLLTSIQKSKDVSLTRFIMALGIKYVGTGTADLLVAKTGTIQSLMEMTEEDLLLINGIGTKVAHSVVDYFSDPKNQEEISKLLELGVNPQPAQVQRFDNHSFTGKSFVLTGSLELYTRPIAMQLIKERGGLVSNSVSKKTDYLLVGADPGSKLDKGRVLGIKILTESEFTHLL